jgi:outer membrane biosynthesis protein TonB
MLRKLLIPAAILGLIAAATLPALAAHNGSSQDHNVAVCHKGRTIHVNEHAVPAHVRHGDTEGACSTAEPSATPTEAGVATETPTPAEEATPTAEPTEEATTTPTPEEPTPTATEETITGASENLQDGHDSNRPEHPVHPEHPGRGRGH